MNITLTRDDLAQLSESARGEILVLALGAERRESEPRSSGPRREEAQYAGIDMTDVVDLSFRQMQKWMATASGPTKAGLYVFATRGPIVRAKTLIEAGVVNLRHFQSRTTIRTRTITGDRDSYLLGWDDWSRVEEGEGRYAVTPTTFDSLRGYFGLS